MTLTKPETHSSIADRDRWVPRGVPTAHPIIIERAEGARVWDVDGKEYLDFVGGIGALNVGHRHPLVLEAIREQTDRLTLSRRREKGTCGDALR